MKQTAAVVLPLSLAIKPGARRFLYLLLAFAFVLLLNACSSGEERPKSSERKQNPYVKEQDGRVTFTLGGTTFNVPKGNFKGVSSAVRGGVPRHADVWGLLPDFEGYDKSKNHYEFVERLGWGNLVQIMLTTRAFRMRIPKLIEKKNNSPVGALSGRAGRYDEMRYGLEYYRNDGYLDDRYIYRVDGIPVIAANCPSKKRMPSSPSCTFWWDVSEGVGARMVFGMEYLPQWHEIWTKANALLKHE